MSVLYLYIGFFPDNLLPYIHFDSLSISARINSLNDSFLMATKISVQVLLLLNEPECSRIEWKYGLPLIKQIIQANMCIFSPSLENMDSGQHPYSANTLSPSLSPAEVNIVNLSEETVNKVQARGFKHTLKCFAELQHQCLCCSDTFKKKIPRHWNVTWKFSSWGTGMRSGQLWRNLAIWCFFSSLSHSYF